MAVPLMPVMSRRTLGMRVPVALAAAFLTYSCDLTAPDLTPFIGEYALKRINDAPVPTSDGPSRLVTGGHLSLQSGKWTRTQDVSACPALRDCPPSTTTTDSGSWSLRSGRLLFRQSNGGEFDAVLEARELRVCLAPGTPCQKEFTYQRE